MFHDFLDWLNTVPGAIDGDPYTSWSAQFAGSLHLWALTEGTHVLAIMLFAGTILIVDLRMLGLMFAAVPVSELNRKVLPMTVTGFALLAITGLLLFLANPLQYYHSVWFRAKVIFLIVAAANIFWFHHRLRRTQPDWDRQAAPPLAVKAAALVSLTSWGLVILFGRLTAFNWFACENLDPGTIGYIFAECAAEMRGVIDWMEE